MDKKPLKPTESELEILNVLWEKGEATVREVHEELSKHKEAGIGAKQLVACRRDRPPNDRLHDAALNVVLRCTAQLDARDSEGDEVGRGRVVGRERGDEVELGLVDEGIPQRDAVEVARHLAVDDDVARELERHRVAADHRVARQPAGDRQGEARDVGDHHATDE